LANSTNQIVVTKSGEESWLTKTNVKIPRVRARRKQMESTVAHRVKAPARRSKSIATAVTKLVREISDRKIETTKRHRRHKKTPALGVVHFVRFVPFCG
jgi:hypothetical protein